MNNLNDDKLKELLLQTYKTRKDYLNRKVTTVEFSDDGETWEITNEPSWSLSLFYRPAKEVQMFYPGTKIRSGDSGVTYIVTYNRCSGDVTLVDTDNWVIPMSFGTEKGSFFTTEHFNQYFSTWEVVK